MTNLLNLKIARVVVNQDRTIEIDVLSVRDLARENDGYRHFTEAVLDEVCQGRVYDDSDTSPTPLVYVYYLPMNGIRINGEELKP